MSRGEKRGKDLMFFVRVISCDIFLKQYVFFWGRAPNHWLQLQSLRDNCPWEGEVLEEAHRQGDFLKIVFTF